MREVNEKESFPLLRTALLMTSHTIQWWPVAAWKAAVDERKQTDPIKPEKENFERNCKSLWKVKLFCDNWMANARFLLLFSAPSDILRSARERQNIPSVLFWILIYFEISSANTQANKARREYQSWSMDRNVCHLESFLVRLPWELWLLMAGAKAGNGSLNLLNFLVSRLAKSLFVSFSNLSVSPNWLLRWMSLVVMSFC